jgi:DNA adenine methylase
MTRVHPVIKWPGSKRSIASSLASLFPNHDRYFEPFVGSGALLPFRKSSRAFASDVISELISLWTVIRDDPEQVSNGYRERWLRRQEEGHTAYYAVRDRFNKTRDPIDFLFLSRTCVNGLIRFNKQQEFNNSLHHTRPGIAPDKLAVVVRLWSKGIQQVSFEVADYRKALSKVRKGDFVFLDPPYEATRGRYHQTGFDASELYTELDRLNTVGANWMLTYDGSAGKRKYTAEIPSRLYMAKLGVTTGHSPFTRLMQTTLDEVVESVYLNYEPPIKITRGTVQKSEKPVQLSVAFGMDDSSSVRSVELKS